MIWRRLGVRNRVGNGQFDLRTGIEPAQDGQVTSRQFGPFFEARQALVPGAPAGAQHGRVNALSAVEHAQPKLPWVIPDFYFDPLRLGVAERIA